MIKKFLSSDLGRGSLVLLITMNLFNALNLIFNVSMAYLLSLESYGVLTILLGSITLLAIFSESVQTVVSRFVSKQRSDSYVNDIIRRSARRALKPSIFLYIVFVCISIVVSYFLDISWGLFLLAGLMIFIGFYNSITRGAMQGKRRFYSLGGNMVIEGGLKLFFSVLLVLVGLSVQGALLGVLLGGVGAFFLSQVSLSDILKKAPRRCSVPEIYDYSKPVFLTMFSVVLFLSLDILLAGFFFDPVNTGAYALASTIAKILFIGTQPISKAMFPFASGVGPDAEKSNAFRKSFVLISFILFIALLLISFFSDKIIFLYSGKVVGSAIAILPFLSIAISLLALTNLVLFYGLSVGRTSKYWALLFFVFFQIVFLSVFSSSLVSFSLANLFASVIFLGGSIFVVFIRK